ncbi:MAG: cytochrome c maturation protein CcmE [bacterium]
MFKKKGKFVIGITAVLVALGYLAVSGFEAGKAYYITATELKEMGTRAHGLRLRVAGTVADGSITRDSFVTRFTLEQAGTTVPIIYSGKEPLPDTFMDGAQAVCDGELNDDGSFEAKKIQAKCASKYEAGYDPATLEPKSS